MRVATVVSKEAHADRVEITVTALPQAGRRPEDSSPEILAKARESGAGAVRQALADIADGTVGQPAPACIFTPPTPADRCAKTSTRSAVQRGVGTHIDLGA